MKERRRKSWNLALWVELNIPKGTNSALVHTSHRLWTWCSKTIRQLFRCVNTSFSIVTGGQSTGAHPKRIQASSFADCWGLCTHQNLSGCLWSERADMQTPVSLPTKLISHPSEPQGLTSELLHGVFTSHHWTRDPTRQLSSPTICHLFLLQFIETCFILIYICVYILHICKECVCVCVCVHVCIFAVLVIGPRDLYMRGKHSATLQDTQPRVRTVWSPDDSCKDRKYQLLSYICNNIQSG